MAAEVKKEIQLEIGALVRLDPDFDLLRGDPRFQKLVAWTAPKDEKK